MTAVAKMGGGGSFEIMPTALESNPPRCASVDHTLYWLVRRSNNRTESWMADPSTTTHATQIARIPKWRAWWNSNKKGFEIVRSLDEAVLERIQVN